MFSVERSKVSPHNCWTLRALGADWWGHPGAVEVTVLFFTVGAPDDRDVDRRSVTDV